MGIYPAFELPAWCRFIFTDAYSPRSVCWGWGRFILDFKFFSVWRRGNHSGPAWGTGRRSQEGMPVYGGLLSAKCLCWYHGQPSPLCRVGFTSIYRRKSPRLTEVQSLVQNHLASCGGARLEARHLLPWAPVPAVCIAWVSPQWLLLWKVYRQTLKGTPGSYGLLWSPDLSAPRHHTAAPSLYGYKHPAAPMYTAYLCMVSKRKWPTPPSMGETSFRFQGQVCYYLVDAGWLT